MTVSSRFLSLIVAAALVVPCALAVLIQAAQIVA